MKKLITIISLSVLLLTTGMANAADKIAVVNVMTVLQKMPQRAAVAKTLDKEFSAKAKALQAEEKKVKEAAQKLQKDGMTMSASERTNLQKTIGAFQEKARAFDQSYRKRESEEMNKLLAKVEKAINTVAEKEQYTVVLKSGSVAYAVKAADITDKVLQQVK